MPRKNVWKFWPVLILLFAVLAVFALLSVFWDVRIFVCELAAALIVITVVLLRLRKLQDDAYSLIRKTAQSLDAADRETLLTFPLPAIVVGETGEILWYNDPFRESVLSGADAFGSILSDIAPALDITAFDGPGGRADVAVRSRRYSVFGNRLHRGLYVFYWIDDTEMKKTAEEYAESRPAVAILMIDNYDELVQNAREGEKSVVVGLVEKSIMEWVSQTTGFVRHSDRDKYILVIEERHLKAIIKSRFDILDRVRQIVSGDRMPATLSIGVGRGGSTLAENEDMSRQALDMALGRGGDQAAVRTPAGFEFYGGTSKAVEKRTKVRTRIIASALTELVQGSDNVIIMGHKNSDLDCVGAAVGIYKAVTSLGKEAKIAINRKASLAAPLLTKLETQGYTGAFIGLEEADAMVLRHTLLVVVDTHRKTLVEFPELFQAVKTVVVIDHHRKMVDYIDSAVIFYHEPFSSSASEMVSELLQYIADRNVTSAEANALLAGITLDTRNFTIRTGVRTFEAAAYLRRKGADTGVVRALFTGSMENFNKMTKLVSSAQVHNSFAVSVWDGAAEPDLRVIAPQAADELLSISGVQASFVLYPLQDGVSISARSMGGVNVQLIMEALGGGGHQSMAGVQLAVSLGEAKKKLSDAIDGYLQQNK